MLSGVGYGMRGSIFDNEGIFASAGEVLAFCGEWALGSNYRRFWDFAFNSQFPKILSFKSICNLRGSMCRPIC